MKTPDRMRELPKVNENSGDIFGGFEVVCKKCGSKAVRIDTEECVDHGEYIGLGLGEVLFKCFLCGNAERVGLQ